MCSIKVRMSASDERDKVDEKVALVGRHDGFKGRELIRGSRRRRSKNGGLGVGRIDETHKDME